MVQQAYEYFFLITESQFNSFAVDVMYCMAQDDL